MQEESESTPLASAGGVAVRAASLIRDLFSASSPLLHTFQLCYVRQATRWRCLTEGAIMLRNTFDKDGPGMVGLVLSYIVFACILAAAFSLVR